MDSQVWFGMAFLRKKALGFWRIASSPCLVGLVWCVAKLAVSTDVDMVLLVVASSLVVDWRWDGMTANVGTPTAIKNPASSSSSSSSSGPGMRIISPPRSGQLAITLYGCDAGGSTVDDDNEDGDNFDDNNGGKLKPCPDEWIFLWRKPKRLGVGRAWINATESAESFLAHVSDAGGAELDVDVENDAWLANGWQMQSFHCHWKITNSIVAGQ